MPEPENLQHTESEDSTFPYHIVKSRNPDRIIYNVARLDEETSTAAVVFTSTDETSARDFCRSMNRAHFHRMLILGPAYPWPEGT